MHILTAISVNIIYCITLVHVPAVYTMPVTSIISTQGLLDCQEWSEHHYPQYRKLLGDSLEATTPDKDIVSSTHTNL